MTLRHVVVPILTHKFFMMFSSKIYKSGVCVFIIYTVHYLDNQAKLVRCCIWI